ncbi:MAG: dockerin type I repeat-containing protein [candidate division Zixibacteria bacterium]|nr:dockerin type I repeat-containing protein [candidate division Zixibacteria bacterium]
MARRFSALLLLLSFLFLTLIGSTAVLGSDKPFVASHLSKTRVAPAAVRFHQDNAPVNSTSGNSKGSMITLNATDHAENIIGYTAYDYQNNALMRRQVEHRGTNSIHFAWMWLEVFDAASDTRDLRYYSYDLTTCAPLSGSTGLGIGGNRKGYTTIDVYQSTAFALPTAHETNAGVTSPTIYYDFGWSTGAPIGLYETHAPTDIYGWGANDGIGPGNENIWPYIDMQIGTETVLHMTAQEFYQGGQDTISTCSYYRRVGAYGSTSGSPNGVWSDQRIVDSQNMGDAIVVADPGSDKVALVWMAPSAFNRGGDESMAYDQDVYYAISSNQGGDWVSTGADSSISQQVEAGVVTGGNCSNYPDPGASENWDGKQFGYSEVQGLYDLLGNLHIVWSTRTYSTDDEHVTFRDGGLYHWSENHTTPSKVYTWPKRFGTLGNGCVTLPDWVQEAGKMSLSICDDGTLYVSFTKFGHDGLCDTEECAGLCTNKDNVNAGDQGGHAVGYLYTVASDDGGELWDAPVRVTGRLTTETEGCWPDTSETTLECHSEMWGSMARYSRIETCGDSTGVEVLDVVYIDDLAPGGVVRGTGAVWSTNPVTWQVTSCREVVYVAEYGDDAGNGLGSCYTADFIVVNPSSDTTTQINLTNTGLLANNFSTSVSYNDGSGWLSIVPASGSIPRNLEDTITLDLTFTAPSGAPDPSTWDCLITITHDADGSPRNIPACMIVSSDFAWPDTATLATACKQLLVYNNAKLANSTANAALDYIDDCDTFTDQTDPTSYLYDASPIIVRLDGSDTLRFMAYSNTFSTSDGLRPLTPLTVDETTFAGSYTYASAELTTSDTSVSMIVEYFVPTHADTCEFIIQRLKVFSGNGSTVNGVLIGELMDWDVPSDSGSNNTTGFSAIDGEIWMVGYEYDDTTNGDCGQLEDDRFGGVKILEPAAVKNAMTLDNATYVYTSGPYETDAPMPPQVSYNKMFGEEGFSAFNSSHADSVATDLSMLITFGQYDLTTTDTLEFIMVLATGKTGETDFLQSFADGKTWAQDHGLVAATCCVEPGGDANGDGPTNVGDAVYLINYAFKGGPAPDCMSEGDANTDGSVNVGDAVYIINYAFKGGPTPVCGTID